MIEEVVLVDENDSPIGTVPKSQVHSENTPLHRAFSSFVFNSKGEVLLQQRSSKKKTWPLVWSNSCCGHPLPNEDREDGVVRRLKDELGLSVKRSDIVFMSHYRYCFTRFGIMENEICPIYVLFCDDTPSINPEEVESIKWMEWAKYVEETKTNPENWSEWCVEEVALLDSLNTFNSWYKELSTRVSN